jgi:hypothetical protein
VGSSQPRPLVRSGPTKAPYLPCLSIPGQLCATYISGGPSAYSTPDPQLHPRFLSPLPCPLRRISPSSNSTACVLSPLAAFDLHVSYSSLALGTEIQHALSAWISPCPRRHHLRCLAHESCTLCSTLRPQGGTIHSTLDGGSGHDGPSDAQSLAHLLARFIKAKDRPSPPTAA